MLLQIQLFEDKLDWKAHDNQFEHEDLWLQRVSTVLLHCGMILSIILIQVFYLIYIEDKSNVFTGE